MKKNNATTDKSAPYRTHSLEKITAPTKVKCEPKCSKITSGGDMRGK
jgi:hypothetical protein